MDSSPETVIRKAGLRATHQRIALVALLLRSKKPLSVEALVKTGKGAFDTTTAYRSLEALASGNVVRRITLHKDYALYELASDHHHHAICTSCGKIEDVSSCVAPSLPARARKMAGFGRITTHTLEFFGLCKRCSHA